MDRAAAELLSPDRASAEGAALGQLACALPDGGLLITASRLVEFGARAAILLAPGLFRLDLTPQEETLGLYPRTLGGWESEWRAFWRVAPRSDVAQIEDEHEGTAVAPGEKATAKA